MYTAPSASPAWVVSNPWGSSVSGAVPKVIVTVPPAFPVALPVLLDFELPHAASVIAAASATLAVKAARVCLLIDLLLLEVLGSDAEIYSHLTFGGTASRVS